MTRESLAGDVLQVPLWPCLHQLQLPAKPIRQQTELEKEREKKPCSYDIPSCRIKYRQMSLFPRTIPDWNSLLQKVVTAESLSLDFFQVQTQLIPVNTTESPLPKLSTPYLSAHTH